MLLAKFTRHTIFTLFALIPAVALGKLPQGFKETRLVKGLSSPVTFGFAPDERLFICEKTGEVKIFKDGKLLENLFVKLDPDSEGEHGLLGIAFDPQFNENHFLYIYYTATMPYVHNRVSRFKADGDVSTESEKIVLELDNLKGSQYHSAGAIGFGPDGKLYIGTGDNAGLPAGNNSQLLTNPFGKVLRVNSDGSIPQDNPFYQITSGIYRSIWAIGFRNPFTFDFQPGTSRFYVNDVGPTDWEEINEGVPGGNYGWPETSGPSGDTRFLAPLFAYSHGPVTSETEGCAISGGAFYSALQFPKEYDGKYFFIDYCNNWMRVLNPEDKTVSPFGTDLAANPVSLKIGPDGSLYYISRWMKNIYRISYSGSSF